jgi:hypothetical protein
MADSRPTRWRREIARTAERRMSMAAAWNPSGPYAPIFWAALWIATGGGAAEIDPTDTAVWREAYDGELLPRLAAEDVRVTGEDQGGERVAISGIHFASCQVDYPYSGDSLNFSNRLYLKSRHSIDETHWRGGFDDALTNRNGDKWRWLMVLKSDVEKHWPFQSAAPPAGAARRGRKPKIDWDGAVKDFVFDRLEHHGAPMPSDPEWNSQAAVERAVADFIMERFHVSMSESHVRTHTTRLMVKWQKARKANN